MSTRDAYDCVVVDYGMGNLHSACRALKAVANGRSIGLSDDPEVVRRSKRIVLPGVGAMRSCVEQLKTLGLDEVISQASASGRPVMGICLGMQLLLEHSSENGGVDCLGVMPGRVRKLDASSAVKVPHMGWNQVEQKPHPLWDGIEDSSYFYFVHSYYAVTDAPVVATAHHGESFAVAIAQDNVFGAQFHPEKSATVGLGLLKNFLDWDGHYSGH